MDNQIKEMSRKRVWKRTMKRCVALLCAVVMLFTMNTLKRNADTLERIAMCGYAEHVHSASCYVGDILSCGITEHVHNDACYQVAPVSIDLDELNLDMDAPMLDGNAGDLDLSLALDGLDLVTEDVAVQQPAANVGETKAFSLGTGAMVSTIIEAVGLNVGLDEIREVGAVENDEAHSGLIAIDKVKGDYRVTARRDFAEAGLALITADDIVVIQLRDGVAPVESVAESSPIGKERQIDGLEQLEGGSQADGSSARDGQPAVEDIAPAEDGQPAVEDIALAEGGQPSLEGIVLAEDGQSVVEDIAPAEDGQTVESAPAEGEQVLEELADLGGGESTDQQQGEAGDDEESDVTDEEKAISREAQPAMDGEVEPGEAQPAMDGEVEPGEAQPAMDGEEQFDIAQPTVYSEVEPDEAQLIEDGESEPDDAQSTVDGEAEPDEEQPAADGEEQLDEEQPEVDGESEPDDAQSTVDGEAEPDEAQPAADGEEQLDEAQPEVDGESEPDDAQPTVDGEAEPDEAQPAADGGEQLDIEQSTIDGEAGHKDEQPGMDGETEPEEAQPGMDTEEQTAEVSAGEESTEEGITEEEPTEEESTEVEATKEETSEEGATEEESTEEEATEEESTEEESTEEETTGEGATEEGATEEESTEEGATEEESTGEGATEEESAGEGATEEESTEEGATEEESTEEETTGEGATEEESTKEESTEEGATEEEATEEETAEEVNAEEEATEEESTEEEATEEETGEEDTGEQPVYATTIDMAEVGEYPMSLNALVKQMAPVSNEAAEPGDGPAEDGEETAEEADEGEEEDAGEAAGETPASAWTVEYDRELLEIAEDGQDCLITPVRSFESTLIVADNDSRYALTLVNCALEQQVTEEAEEPEAEQPSRPAQVFEGSTEYVRVSVTAPEGAFPEGTTMALADVEDEKTLTDIEDTVSEGFVKVERVHAVDITFFDADNNEIEPLVPISVVMTVAEIDREEAAVVVHVDDAGAPQVVESRSEAPEGETGLKVEMPAAETAEGADEPEEPQTDAKPQANTELHVDAESDGVEDASVGFEADSFSVYAVVVTRTLETKFIDARGDTWNISVRYSPEAEIPDTAALAVSEVTDERYLADAEAALEGGKRVTLARFFDIKIMDGETEIQPKQPVEVSVALDNTGIDAIEPQEHVIDSGETEVCAVHFAEANTDIVTAAETEEAVVFDAESFSVWGVMYTVDFYYGDYEYHMPGEESITLSALFDLLYIQADAALAEAVVFTNPELVDVGRLEDGSDWLLTSLAPFDTEEKLTATMEDGTVYQILVKDKASYDFTFRVNEGSRGYFSGTFVTSGYVKDKQTGSNGHVTRFTIKADTDKNYGTVANAESGSRFAFMLNDDGSMAQTRAGSNGNTLDYSDYSNITRATTVVAYFAPSDAKVIVINDDENGSIDVNGGWYRYIDDDNSSRTFPKYFYSTDNITLTASTNKSGYFFIGWYDDDGALYSTNAELRIQDINKDIVLKPVFEQVFIYNVVSNTVTNIYVENGKPEEIKTGKFLNPNNNNWQVEKIEGLSTERLGDTDACSFRNSVKTESNDDRYEFAYWLRDDGSTPVTEGSDLIGYIDPTTGSARDKYNILDDNATFIAFYKPKGDYIVRMNKPKEGGRFEYRAIWYWVDKTRKVELADKTIDYYFAGDHAIMQAIPDNGWYFDGWYNNGTEKISSNEFLNVFEYVNGEYYHNKDFPNCHESPLLEHKKNLNLTPVFKKKEPFFNVWFDGTNGLGGGEAGRARDTLFARVNGKGQIEGATSVYMKAQKQNYNSNNPQATYTATVILPRTAQVTKPMSQGDNKFVLKGWYEVYTGQYYQPGQTVTITQDAVFYADWMPEHYNIGQNSNLAGAISTNNFITTRMYDYNNLFNVGNETGSIYLDLGQSTAQMPVSVSGLAYDTWKTDVPVSEYNNEQWHMKGSGDDFVFFTAVSGYGRSMDPWDRDEKNQNRETSTNGRYYTAIPTQGLLSNKIKDKLFSTEDPAYGKKYLGTGDYLYSYDNSTGYYYYDSDKNAASYNHSAQRFYVYNYTNKTNKSNGGDNADFLPLNYGNATFTEMYGAPNYWFGMSSEINFFLPNPTGYRDENNVTGNRSIKGDEMVYKFAGDDDVWVFVDGQLVLDMGGVHGKIYGEINFSQGTWTIAYNGADKTVDNRNIMSYSGGSTLNGTLNGIGEGDHTLTLYYLERGSSQSNCAIYFNLAPRYQLRFEKKDSLKKNGLQGARFGVYVDAACTIAADLKHWNETTNEFTSGNDGIVHAQGLAAGRTYYIKELQAPADYPDMSGYVMALTLDSHGNPTITVPAGAANMVDTSGLEAVSGKDRTYRLNMVNGQPDMIYLPILNNSETSITATKTWSLLDGKEYRTFEMDGKLITEYENSAASVKVQLQRYYEDNNNGETVGDHTVQLVTQYFGSSSGTSNRDDASLAHYQTETRTVGDGGRVSFSLATDTGVGIYSVVSTGGSLSSHVTGTTEGKPFRVNGSSANRPNAGDYTVSNIRNDAVIYITIIGATNSEADLMGMVHLTSVQATNGDGTARRISQDTGFNSDPKDKNGGDIPNNGVVTLSKDNGWTHTWENLATVDGQGHRVYYYVKENDPVTPQSEAFGGASAFIKTTSSDGLSGGIITVHNTLRAVKVKLRKRDAEYANGNRVDLKGAEFAIYTEAEYQKYKNNQSASAMAPNVGLINSGEMGQYVGTKLVTDDLGRFYTGFLPNGKYYIVETKAPDGYVPLEHDIKIHISETGLAYDLNGGDNFVTRKADSDGVYNLFIDNTMDVGSIRLQKQWKTGSDYGLVRNYENEYQANPPSFGLDGDNKLYSSSDNGAKAVLLSLGCVVNGAVDASAVSDVYANPTSYGLSADQIVDINGAKYIKLAKTGAEWPTLTVSNLPLKRYADVSYTDRGQTMTHIAPVDGWYFIEEYGYIDASDRVVRVENKTNDWTVSYGYVNGATNGSGKTENVAGTDHNLILAKKNDPDTLTVTNGFKGGLTFNKQDGSGHPVAGAVFQIVPDGAGEGNFVTGVDDMLTSGENGAVNISGLPIGTYSMWEKEAPAGYKKTDAMYRLEIGYTQSHMYDDGSQTEVHVVDNTPLGALKITKTVQVDGAAPTEANRAKTSGVYTFTASGLGGTDTDGVTRTVTITFADGKAIRYQIDSGVEVTIPEAEATDNSWTVTVPDLVPGTYTIGETLPENGMTLKSVNAGTKVEGELAFVTVVAGDTTAVQESALATFVNNYGKADVKIVKIDENTRTGAVQEKLSGAVFTLVRGDEDPETHQVSYNAIYPNANDGVRRTDDQGELTFENLPDGHYRLQETGVPDGYVLTSDPYIYFTITDGALSWTDSSGKPITDGQEHNKVTCDTTDKTFTVGNEPGVSLPATGGHGTLPHTFVGTLLILCALAIAVDRRRRQGNS